ncbi:MAG: FlgD immunoglobulin-like domain containing protein [Candidatus Neomarinimicrobiota bacterium]
MQKLFITTIFLLSKIFADCSDLDYSDCLYWSSDCEWNDETETCQYIGGGGEIEYGPYEFTSISQSDGMRDGPLYQDTELYFPINYTGMLKSIVLGAGHGDSGESMYYWASLLASHGFIAATIDFNDPINESHYQRGLAMLDLVETVKQENSRSSSPIFGLMDTTKFALIGSSMSGGAIIEAAISDSLEILDAIISLNPTVIFEDCGLCAGSEYCICLVPEFLQEQDTPILIISGENEADEIGYEGLLGMDIYLDHPDSTTKMIYEILDGGHSSAIPQIESIRIKVINWLDYYLNDDNTVCSLLLEEPDNTSQFLTNFECQQEELRSTAISMPVQYSLHQNYPNPFNPVTTLTYDLPKDSFVHVIVYDILGNVINDLVNTNQSSGYRSIQWNGTNNQGESVSAGLYLYTIHTGDFVDTKKMILLK